MAIFDTMTPIPQSPTGMIAMPGQTAAYNGRPYGGAMDFKGMMRGHLGSGYVDMGGLGGGMVGLVGDGNSAQFAQNVDLGPLAGFINPLTQMSQDAFSGLGQINPAALMQQLQGAYGQAAPGITGPDLAPFGYAATMQPLQQQMTGAAQGALATAAQDPQAIMAQQLGLLREQAAPFEQRAFNNLQDNLFATGRLGSSGGGLQTEAFARGLGQADLSRQLQAFQQAQQYQRDAANRASMFGQGADSLLGAGFQRALAGNSAVADRALQRFGLAQTLFDAGMGQRQNLLGEAMGGLQGFSGIQQYGLNNLQQALAGSQAVSNAALGRASTKGGSNFEKAMGGLSAFGDAAGGAAAAFTAFSDPALKADIEYIGTSRGLRLYRWRWNDAAKAFGLEGAGAGVMATEVPAEYVAVRAGYLAVDYGRLLEEAA